MGKKKEMFIEWIRKKARGESALADLIQFAYHLFANTYVQAFIAFFGTIVIGLMMEDGNYGMWFWVAVALYGIATFLIAWANRYIQRKVRDTKAFQAALFGLSTTLRSFSITFQRCVKALHNDTLPIETKEYMLNDNVNFQTASFTVCTELRNMLSREVGKTDVYATLYQYFEEAGKTPYCRMIATPMTMK